MTELGNLPPAAVGLPLNCIITSYLIAQGNLREKTKLCKLEEGACSGEKWKAYVDTASLSQLSSNAGFLVENLRSGVRQCPDQNPECQNTGTRLR